FSGPRRVSQGIRIGDVDDRVIVKPFDVTLGSIGTAPTRAFHEGPPLTPVAQIDRTLWWSENQGTRKQRVRECARIVIRIGWNFHKRDVTSCVYEFLELSIRYWLSVDPEITDRDAMNRRLFGIMPVGSHAKRAARDSDHVFCAG